jgi:two-component system NtrC family sensor kinase
MVVADKERIAQVISNLLDNVFTKVTREKAAAITGETLGKEQMSGSNGQVLVRIEDTGSGSDPEIVPKSLKGTGLGLFISKSIIEAHGGLG